MQERDKDPDVSSSFQESFSEHGSFRVSDLWRTERSQSTINPALIEEVDETEEGDGEEMREDREGEVGEGEEDGEESEDYDDNDDHNDRVYDDQERIKRRWFEVEEQHKQGIYTQPLPQQQPLSYRPRPLHQQLPQDLEDQQHQESSSSFVLPSLAHRTLDDQFIDFINDTDPKSIQLDEYSDLINYIYQDDKIKPQFKTFDFLASLYHFFVHLHFEGFNEATYTVKQIEQEIINLFNIELYQEEEEKQELNAKKKEMGIEVEGQKSKKKSKRKSKKIQDGIETKRSVRTVKTKPIIYRGMNDSVVIGEGMNLNQKETKKRISMKGGPIIVQIDQGSARKKASWKRRMAEEIAEEKEGEGEEREEEMEEEKEEQEQEQEEDDTDEKQESERKLLEILRNQQHTAPKAEQNGQPQHQDNIDNFDYAADPEDPEHPKNPSPSKKYPSPPNKIPAPLTSQPNYRTPSNKKRSPPLQSSSSSSYDSPEQVLHKMQTPKKKLRVGISIDTSVKKKEEEQQEPPKTMEVPEDSSQDEISFQKMDQMKFYRMFVPETTNSERNKALIQEEDFSDEIQMIPRLPSQKKEEMGEVQVKVEEEEVDLKEIESNNYEDTFMKSEEGDEQKEEEIEEKRESRKSRENRESRKSRPSAANQQLPRPSEIHQIIEYQDNPNNLDPVDTQNPIPPPNQQKQQQYPPELRQQIEHVQIFGNLKNLKTHQNIMDILPYSNRTSPQSQQQNYYQQSQKSSSESSQQSSESSADKESNAGRDSNVGSDDSELGPDVSLRSSPTVDSEDEKPPTEVQHRYIYGLSMQEYPLRYQKSYSMNLPSHYGGDYLGENQAKFNRQKHHVDKNISFYNEIQATRDMTKITYNEQVEKLSVLDDNWQKNLQHTFFDQTFRSFTGNLQKFKKDITFKKERMLEFEKTYIKEKQNLKQSNKKLRSQSKSKTKSKSKSKLDAQEDESGGERVREEVEPTEANQQKSMMLSFLQKDHEHHEGMFHFLYMNSIGENSQSGEFVMPDFERISQEAENERKLRMLEERQGGSEIRRARDVDEEGYGADRSGGNEGREAEGEAGSGRYGGDGGYVEDRDYGEDVGYGDRNNLDGPPVVVEIQNLPPLISIEDQDEQAALQFLEFPTQPIQFFDQNEADNQDDNHEPPTNYYQPEYQLDITPADYSFDHDDQSFQTPISLGSFGNLATFTLADIHPSEYIKQDEFSEPKFIYEINYLQSRYMQEMAEKKVGLYEYTAERNLTKIQKLYLFSSILGKDHDYQIVQADPENFSEVGLRKGGGVGRIVREKRKEGEKPEYPVYHPEFYLDDEEEEKQ